MKILRVIASMDPTHGGPAQGIRNSIPEMLKLGVSNEVVTLDDPAAVFLSIDSFPIHALGPASGPWNYSAKLIPWLLKNLNTYDVIIIHGLWLYHGFAVKKALQLFKRKEIANSMTPNLFVMPHGMLDPYFQSASGRKIKAIRNWIYWKLIESKIVNTATGVLFTCEEELFLARKPFRPYHPKREINVGYGIIEPPSSTPRMKQAFLEKCSIPAKRPYFLFLSRIHKKKGADILIRAYVKLIKSNLSDFENLLPALVIAGPGLETDYGKSLRRIIAENPEVESLVFFPGMLEGEAKWGAFYNCEAFTLPSHQENFGIAVVEALACKKTVLISNKVNIWRELKASGGGIVADDNEKGAWELLKSWQEMTIKEKRDMANNARACYEKNFAIGPNVGRLKNAINNA